MSLLGGTDSKEQQKLGKKLTR